MPGPATAWVDDLFPFRTPPPLARLVDIGWRHATAEGYYDPVLLLTRYDFMFDLVGVPRPPVGWECSPEFDDHLREPPVPMFATPEFVPFGAMGDGGYVGWAVPAPELGRLDHPVCHADGHQHGVILLGEDTRAGLEFMVLAPAEAFAGREPVVARVELDEPLEPALADAARQLDAGCPATALLGLEDTFVSTPPCYFAELRPLWARAYRELGRPKLVATLDLMAALYGGLPCYCAVPHT